MSTISSQESANVLRNFVKVGVSSITYLRNLFVESAFEDTVIGGLQLKRLTRAIPESAALLDWIEDGVFDAMSREYLKHLVLSIHNSEHVALESYTFSLQYGGQDCDGVPSVYSVQLSVGHGPMVDNSTGSAGEAQGSITNTRAAEGIVVNADKEDVKRQTVKVLRDLVLLAQSLSPLPDTRFLSMRLLYYDERVPADYEPPHFRSASGDEEFGVGLLNLDQQVGELETGHHNLAVDVRSCCYIDDNVTTYKTGSKPFDTLTRRTSMSSAKPSAPPSAQISFQENETTSCDDTAAAMRLPPGSAVRRSGVHVAARPPGANRTTIFELLKRGHELSRQTKFVSKDRLSNALGVDPNITRVVLKKMIDYGYIDSKFVKGKGYMSLCFEPSKNMPQQECASQ
ncbi:HORMA domain-containing protein 1 [Babesia sp. Xinjiang]|uniref:HORMA domain-containing protein 1 n=1 Tax=Babesia sp. Xinjiang TaxID=462227 RepID=UPI000A255CA7|nr:HORMA domain-containing protein 1 [Babesia sp. Xinjiang]ORM41402.1 HORMA domain-containing protein 1 [Babesia sp. Xinjiang]